MTIVFKVSDNVKQKMIKHYQTITRENKPPYSVFQAIEADTVITLYESGKAMFQGISADVDANLWVDMEKHLNNRVIDINDKKKDKTKDSNLYMHAISSIGSDEVGTGDYFGPVVVTAAYVAKKDISFMEDLGVKDSKVLDDGKIKKIAPLLMKKVPYCTFILDNTKYNELYSETCNMNKIKAILHNKVLVGLIKKGQYDYQKIIMDQFVYPKKYFEHIKEAKEKVTNITFETKAESKYYSVAAASIISRYLFLKAMAEMSSKYKINIPLGASKIVDEVGQKLCQTFGNDVLTKIAKLNFKNTDRIIT